MASSSADIAEAGFATPAATVVSLAIGLTASAITATSVMELRLAHADRERATADYALAGAQQEAALASLTAGPAPRLTWTQNTTLGAARVLAERQSSKLSVAAAAGLSGEVLARLGVADPDALRARLGALADVNASDFAVETADASPLWKMCGRSLISPYGAATAAPGTKATAPVVGTASWRIGETWRLRIAAADGWVDDRIVRFTGDPRHPAAVVERRLARTNRGEGACESVFVAGPGA